MPSRAQDQRHRRARDLDDHGLRPHPHGAHPGQGESGKYVVPIVPDEARTFGMEGPVPAARNLCAQGPALRAGGRRPAHVLPRGQEGPRPAGGYQRGRRLFLVDRGGHRRTAITASAWCRSTSFTRCSGSSGSEISHGRRVTYRLVASSIGGTAGRTTLAGEGLQHDDGHSHLCMRRIFRTACPTTRPTRTRWP